MPYKYPEEDQIRKYIRDSDMSDVDKFNTITDIIDSNTDRDKRIALKLKFNGFLVTVSRRIINSGFLQKKPSDEGKQ